MRRCTLLAVVWTALILPMGALAEEEIRLAEEGAGFTDAPLEPSALPAAASEAVVGSMGVGLRSSSIELGPEGIDDQGRHGRLHTVLTGDTLWDLSAAYLGTAWVWPSIWIDNGEIDDPHRIFPGDKIWITANEMRVVSDREAEAFLAPQPQVAESPTDLGTPASAPVAALEEAEEATFSELPVELPAGTSPTGADREITVSRRAAMGFLSAERFAGSTTILDSPVERIFLAEGDRVYLGLGEGDVEVGDQFTVFRAVEEVRDPERNRLLGHHVETLGWVEVKELTGDTSIAEIRASYSEIDRGTRVTPRPTLPRVVTMRTTPDVIEGEVVFLPSGRTLMGDGGYVYLNRGELHGVELGSELEIYESGEVMTDRTRGVDVRTPDRVVAQIVVVRVEPESSVAFVTKADRELAVGDAVRPTVSRLARR